MKDAAHELDEKAQGFASDYLRTEGHLLSVLMEMHRQKHFVRLNYANIFDYCERRLKLSRAQESQGPCPRKDSTRSQGTV